MKSIKYFAIIALIILMAYLILRKATADKVIQNYPNNQTTLIENQKIKNTTQKPTANKIKEPEVAQLPIESNLTDPIMQEKTDVSDYVTAFRDWQYFENCYTDVQDFNNKKDPLLSLSERFEGNIRESQSEPTPQQNSYYQYHVDVCKTLISLTDYETDYYLGRDKLKSRYEKIIPKTDQEKQLAHALELIRQLESFNLEYSNAYNSRSTLSDDDIAQINNKINTLTEELVNIYEKNEELTEQQLIAIGKLNTQISALNTTIQQNSSNDEATIQQIDLKINGHLNSIDDYLHRVQSPDAFLILAQTLYRIEYYKKNSTVIKNLKSQTGLYDSYYINILNKIVMPLVACSMNYPCDAQSDSILSYCLGLRDSMFNQACGRTLEDFYFNFYIGPNQLSDVYVYFNYLVNRYAQ